MKVKKLTRSLKSRLGIKDLRVNLIRLDKNTIYRMIGMNKSVSTYNISMRLKNGEVVCVQDSGEALSMIITVKSIHPSSPPIPSTINSQPTSDMPMLQSSNQYSLRARAVVQPKKPEPKISTAVSEISVSLKKRQLWSSCKKDLKKEKLVLGAIVFAKQVCFHI